MADQQLALMQRGEATMNVPVSKVEEYLKDGWKEISRTEPITLAPLPPELAAELSAPPPEKKGRVK